MGKLSQMKITLGVVVGQIAVFTVYPVRSSPPTAVLVTALKWALLTWEIIITYLLNKDTQAAADITNMPFSTADPGY